MTTSPRITFGNNAIAIKDDATFSINLGSLQSFSDLNDLKSDGSVITTAYATFEPDFWVLDGNYHFVPTGSAHVGWMTTNMSGADTHYAGGAQPELLITFPTTYSTNGLTLHFSDFTGDYTDQIEIVFYNASEVTITDVTYHPTGSVFQTNAAVSNFKKILFKFQSASKAYRYARLQRIEFDTINDFTGTDIRDAHLIEQISPLSVELPVNTLDFTLYSADGNFSIVAPSGVYAYLQYKDPIDVHEDVNGLRAYMGRFYLDEWSSQSENLANFKASDAIGLLDIQTDVGRWMDLGVLVPNVIDEIFLRAGIKYSLDSDWNTVGILGWLPVATYRENLQRVLFSMPKPVTHDVRAVASCARSNIVKIQARKFAGNLTASDYDFILTSSDYGQSPTLTLRPYVSSVEVAGFYWAGNGQSLLVFNSSLASGTYTLLVDNAPMTNYNYIVTGATLYSGSANSVIVTTPSTSTAYIWAQKLVPAKKIFTSINPDTSSVADNVIQIADVGTVAQNIGQVTADNVLTYYTQRYKMKMRLYGSLIKPGNYVLVTVQNGKQLSGIVEKVESDLAGGMISDVEISGVIL